MSMKKRDAKTVACVVVFLVLARVASADSDYVPYYTRTSLLTAIEAGADFLAGSQNTNGGWDWSADDLTNPAVRSYDNLIAEIMPGAAQAYDLFPARQGDWLPMFQNASSYMQSATTASNVNTTARSGGADLNWLFSAAEVDRILGGTAVSDFLDTGIVGPLDAGTSNMHGWGAGTYGGTATYREDQRTGANINYRPYDLGHYLYSMASTGMGSAAGVAEITQRVKNGVETIKTVPDPTYYNDPNLGLATAIWALAEAGETNWGPTKGAYAGPTNIVEMTDVLASRQSESGAFHAYDYDYSGVTYQYYPSVPATARALVAMNAVDPVRYEAEIKAAASFLLKNQEESGSWRVYPEGTESVDGQTNSTGVAIEALAVSPMPNKEPWDNATAPGVLSPQAEAKLDELIANTEVTVAAVPVQRRSDPTTSGVVDPVGVWMDVEETLLQEAIDLVPGEFVTLSLSVYPEEIEGQPAMSRLLLSWWDETNGRWVYGGTQSDGDPGEGVNVGVSAPTQVTGDYGVFVDGDTWVFWTNTTHASDFGLLLVPEPASLILAAMGAVVILRRRL